MFDFPQKSHEMPAWISQVKGCFDPEVACWRCVLVSPLIVPSGAIGVVRRQGVLAKSGIKLRWRLELPRVGATCNTIALPHLRYLDGPLPEIRTMRCPSMWAA